MFELDGHAEEAELKERVRRVQRLLVDRVKRQAAAGGPGAEVPSDEGSDQLWAVLASAAAEYRNSILAVRLADVEYLSLVRQLNVNQNSGETKKVMVHHPECEQPVMFVVPQIKVGPGPPHVRDRLQSNRATFVALHGTMQELP